MRCCSTLTPSPCKNYDYTATLCGKVVNPKGQTIKPVPTHDGYHRFSKQEGSNQRLVRINRFVWEFFNGEIPEGMHVDHKNGDRADNRLHNLQLLTPQENLRRRKSVKLTEQDVEEIRASDEKNCVLGPRYGVAPQTISKIRKGIRW